LKMCRSKVSVMNVTLKKSMLINVSRKIWAKFGSSKNVTLNNQRDVRL
jgi:hypothetical protein